MLLKNLQKQIYNINNNKTKNEPLRFPKVDVQIRTKFYATEMQ